MTHNTPDVHALLPRRPPTKRHLLTWAGGRGTKVEYLFYLWSYEKHLLRALVGLILVRGASGWSCEQVVLL